MFAWLDKKLYLLSAGCLTIFEDIAHLKTGFNSSTSSFPVVDMVGGVKIFETGLEPDLPFTVAVPDCEDASLSNTGTSFGSPCVSGVSERDLFE